MFSLVLHTCVFAVLVGAWYDGLAPRPPMGWANWNGFGCNYNDQTIRDTADALVSLGLRDAGYNTIIVQECITPVGHRTASGVPIPDPQKFPYGMANLTAYVHSKGLKVGIYTDVGPETCAGYEGSFGHEDIDAQTYADWGFDFIEEDSCHHPVDNTTGSLIPYRDLYQRMHNAILNTGRDMLFYVCVQGQDNVAYWGPSTAHLWRTTGDIMTPHKPASWANVLRNFDANAAVPSATGPGHWQDPDMLVVGLAGLTPQQQQSHFSLWVLSAAPLWIGIDLTTITPAVKALLSNAHAIAIDQDPLGVMATLRDVPSNPSLTQVWARPLALAKGAVAVGLFNRANRTLPITVPREAVGVPLNAKYVAFNVWDPTLTIKIEPGVPVLLRRKVDPDVVDLWILHTPRV